MQKLTNIFFAFEKIHLFLTFIPRGNVRNLVVSFGTKYSRMELKYVKYVEVSLTLLSVTLLNQTFKGCLSQILHGPFLNTLSHL